MHLVTKIWQIVKKIFTKFFISPVAKIFSSFQSVLVNSGRKFEDFETSLCFGWINFENKLKTKEKKTNAKDSKYAC